MGFEQLAKLRDELAKQANAQPRQKQAAQTGAKDARAKDTKPRHAKPTAQPAAKTAGNPSQPKAAARQNPVDPVVHTIGKLQKRFPLTFPKNPAPKVALKIGILEDLLAQAGELRLSEREIRDAVSTWCRGSRYWASLAEGASRVDLAGAETGKVTASDSAVACRRSGGQTKPAKSANEPAADAEAAEDGGKSESSAGGNDVSNADQSRG